MSTIPPPHIPNIFKESENNFLFKVLGQLGDNKHDKDIQKHCANKRVFYMEGGGVKC